EIQGQETAWANDLGRLCHELEYVRWADRAQRTAAWVQETYPDESTRQRLTDGENWSLLVDADPAHHFVGKAQSTDTVRSIRQHCRPRPQPQHFEDGNTMSTQQRQTVMDDQLRRVHQELRSRRASIRQDPPARSEEHTSELQSRFDLVCRLLLEKKKIPTNYIKQLIQSSNTTPNVTQ